MTADEYLDTRDPLLVADGVGVDADTLCHEIRMAFLAGEAEGMSKNQRSATHPRFAQWLVGAAMLSLPPREANERFDEQNNPKLNP